MTADNGWREVPVAKRRNASLGMTLVETVVVITIVAILVAFLGGYIYRKVQQYNAVYGFSWTTAPATIPPAPATATFVYHVTQKLDAVSPTVPFEGRTVKFDLNVTKMDGKIVSCNGNPVATPGKTCTVDSDKDGNLTIVVSLEQQGEANLVATDVTKNKSETPQSFSAP